MTEAQIFECLCYKDPRNPTMADFYGHDDDSPPEPRVNCACDNCFYGRDRLALEILRLRGEAPNQKELAAEVRSPKYTMVVETDWDFSVKFRGQLYPDYSFTLHFNSVDELDELEVCGAFGAAGHEGKSWEFLAAIEAIKRNPNEDFSNTGGNRGVEWYVNK